MAVASAVPVVGVGVGSGVYRMLLVVHILLVIAGLGTVVLNGLYATRARQRPGPEGRAISEANYAVSRIAEVLILGIPVSGLALVWASDGAWSLSDGWVWLSLLLFGVALAISLGVLGPSHRRANGILATLETESPDVAIRAAEVERLGRVMAVSGSALNLLLVVILALMVWKPA
jgi:uncharacterized membrane protein